jgi:predicted extracellular nuclease
MEYCAAFWNLENLFDVVNSPRRTEKLQRTVGNELAGWTTAVLNRKIHQLASVIGQLNQGRGPDVLGVCEVENRYVLDLLANALAPLGRDYGIVHYDTVDDRGIDVAFLYDDDLLQPAESFSHYVIKRSATRDIVQVNFRTVPDDRLLVLIGNHWPSRSGGQYESEPYRIIAGETLAYFHQRIQQIYGADTAVLAMGDFNDEPYDRSITSYACAERTRAKVTRARSPRFLNLMWGISGQGIGTHYYNNAPNVLDQFLASRGVLTGASGFRVIPDSVDVVRFPEMVSTGSYPVPIRYGRKDQVNRDGFSDHFPIALTVRTT